MKKVIYIILFILVSFYNFNCSAKSKNDNIVEDALTAARGGDPKVAIPLLESAEKKHPFHSANSEVLYQLGTAYIDIGKYDKAEKVFNILLKRYGKYADKIVRVDSAKIAQARILTAKGKFDEAIQHLKKFLKDRPKSLDKDSAYYQLASTYIEKGDYAKAEKLLKPVAVNEKSQMHDGAIFLMATIAAKQKNYKQTEKLMALLVKTAKSKDAKNSALFKLGDIYRQSGNLIKAIDQYRRIKSTGNDLEARKLNAGILFEIAQTYEKLGHPLEAHIAFDGVAKLYADTELSTEAWHRAILSDADFGYFDRAEKSYLDFLKNFKDKKTVEDTRLYFAQKLIENKNFSNAIYHLKKGVKEFPTGQYAEISYNLLGMAYLKNKQYADAEQSLKNFAKQFPESELVPSAYFMLAEAFAERKLYNKALTTLENLVNDFPNSSEAQDAKRRIQEIRMVYADYLSSTNRFIAAIEQYGKITAEDLLENAGFLIAETYNLAGQYDNAATAYQDFVEKFPDSTLVPQAKFSIGESLMQAEKYAEAEKMFNSIIDGGIAETNPVLPFAQLQIAFCRYYLDDTPGMSNALAKVIEKFPTSSEAGDAYYWIGYLQRSAMAYKEAAKTYETLYKNFPTHNYAAEAAYLSGESCVLANNFAKAIEIFKTAFNKYSKTGYGVISLVRAGDIYNQKYHQLDTFLAEADKIIAKNPNVKTYVDLAKAAALMHANKPAEAEKFLPDISKIKYNDILGYALAVKAGVLNEKNQWQKAAAAAKQAVNICKQTNVGLDEALFQNARAFFLQKDYENAETLYTKLLNECVIADNFVNAVALLDRAECLLNMQEYDEIIGLCDQAVKLRPGSELSARALVLKGNSMYNRNEYKIAAQYFKRAAILYGKIEKYGPTALKGLINSYKKLGLTEQAAAEQKKLLELYPNAK